MTSENKSCRKTLEEILGAENVVHVSLKGKPFYVVSDAHDGYENYMKVEKKEDLIDKMKNGEAYVIDLGDFVHPERIKEWNMEPKFLDREIEIKETLKKLGKEEYYICVKGNHEHEAIKSYEARKAVDGHDAGIFRLFYKWLKKFGLGKALTNLWHEIRFPSKKLTERRYLYLKSLPIAVIVENSIVLTHGGYPSRKHYFNREKAIHETLWKKSGDAAEFLNDIGAKLLINGHVSPNHGAFMYNIFLALRGRAKWDIKKKIAIIYNNEKIPTRVMISPFKPEIFGSYKGFFGGGGGSYLKLNSSDCDPDKWEVGKQVMYLD
ncbi:MAG: metallophosphoesterase [Candidatus Pacearchaeota archaeon]